MWLTHTLRRRLSNPYSLPPHISGAEFSRLLITVWMRQIKARFGFGDPLTRLATKYKSVKGVTIFPFHGYTVYYSTLFQRFRDEPISLLEIGLSIPLHRKSIGVTCPSLGMWLEYFSNASIY